MSDKPVIVSLGEVLWDLFPGDDRFGGAPANFASQCALLGAQSWMLSAVGDDDRGHEAIRRLQALGVNTEGVAVLPDFPTGFVDVRIDAAGKPGFDIGPECAWDQVGAAGFPAGLPYRTELVCFGTLAQRNAKSRTAYRAFLFEMPDENWKLFDANLRKPYYDRELVEDGLGRANALKISDDELELMAGLFDIEIADQEAAMRELAERFKLDAIGLTCGGDGARLLVKNELVFAPAPPTEVRDTVGAGDAFTATMAMGLVRGTAPQQIVEDGVKLASWVCSQDCAVPGLPPE